jgi:putative PIN family toxin of toxin-antitoxin system
MKIVLDTNVLVSGLLAPFGSSGEILRMVFSGELTLCLDARILAEYKDVLYWPKFKFNRDHINVLLDFIKQYGQFISSLPLQNRLPDPDDEPFLEVAIAGRVVSLVTGNCIHYPTSPFKGINILPPSQFVEFYRNQDKSGA